MAVGPEFLLAVDRGVIWPDSRGTLRRVVGPVLELPGGASLTWFDPLDGRPQVESEVEPGALSTCATAVEWPDAYPDGLSGAAVCVGDPASVAFWDADSEEYSTDRGMGCVVVTDRVPEVVRLLEDLPVALALLSSVREATLHPVELNGDLVGIAFHCGMGASTNRVFLGRDGDGRAVALLADLELLACAELSPEA